MSSFGFESPLSRRLAWGGAIAVETALAVGVAVGSDGAAYLAAALQTIFAATIGSAIGRGKLGAHCGCFGPASKVGWIGLTRNLALAAVFVMIPALDGVELSSQGWLAVGLVISLLISGALALALVALAREVGMLRLRLGPNSALEIAEEGPALGSRSGLIEGFRFGAEEEFGLAVFTSPGCRVCRVLGPTIELIGREPLVELARYEEDADAAVWQREAIPGSPFAVVLERDGLVLSKGTFNNLAQLEGLLAAAERRRRQWRNAPLEAVLLELNRD